MKKVFRIEITEQFNFYHDIEAENMAEAQRLTRKGLDNGDIAPVHTEYESDGYQIQSAVEIPREKSDIA